MKKTKSPHYVVINNEKLSLKERSVLRKNHGALKFPLSDDDLNIARILEDKFDNEENCAGLAAPQIGFAKPIIVFAATTNNDLKKWREDFSQTMPKTIWVNPSYEPIDDAMHEDFEACFSVADIGGSVKRFSHIKYTAYLLDGTKVEGRAEGYLARVIQHEVDHVRGILFVDKVADDKFFSMEDYKKIRAKRISKKND